MSAPTVSMRLAQIAEQSRRNPTWVFTTLAHHVDEDFLTEAFHQLRKNAAAGIDEVTVTDYRRDLKENIASLHAEKVYRVLPKRFERFGLRIHPEKSRLVPYGRPLGRDGKGPGTFAFLGCDHYWGRTLQGGGTIKRKTQGKRLRRFPSGMHEWCRKHRHRNIVDQYQILKSKLRGHYEYYGVRGNYKMLEVAYEHIEQVWKRWLGQRSSTRPKNWEQWLVKWRDIYPLPKPRIMHAL